MSGSPGKRERPRSDRENPTTPGSPATPPRTNRGSRSRLCWNTPAPAASATPIADEKSGLVDAQVLLAACGGEDAILRNICAVFRDRVPNHLQAAQAALRDRDAPRLREAAHKLCGMIAAFSSVAGTKASHLEDHAAGGRLEDCQLLVEQLDEIARELVQQVDGLSIETLRRQAPTVAAPSRRA